MAEQRPPTEPSPPELDDPGLHPDEQLPILRCFMGLVASQDERRAMIAVDTSRRPAVSDAIRVALADSDGRIRYEVAWTTSAYPLLDLEIGFLQPVQCAFFIRFDLRETDHRHVLKAAARRGSLPITLGAIEYLGQEATSIIPRWSDPGPLVDALSRYELNGADDG